jgi:LysR family transcriptional regulator, glycine cleavage system transcriptional activator
VNESNSGSTPAVELRYVLPVRARSRGEEFSPMRIPSMGTLKAFELAAQTGSFRHAAKKLSITPSAVSYRLKALEGCLGVQLFHRGARSLTLTAAGAAYLWQIEELFRGLDAATRELISRFGRRSLRLRVAPFFASEFLLPRLERLHAMHPEVDLQVETNNSPVSPLEDVDLAIVLGAGPWPQAEVIRLFGQSYVAACAPGLTAQYPIQKVADLNGHALLVHTAHRDSWERWAAAGAMERPTARKRVLFDTMTELVRATERGLGVGLIPIPLAVQRIHLGQLTRLFEHALPSAESYFLMHRVEDASRAEVAGFREWLIKELSTEVPRLLRSDFLHLLPTQVRENQVVNNADPDPAGAEDLGRHIHCVEHVANDRETQERTEQMAHPVLAVLPAHEVIDHRQVQQYKTA